MVDQPGSSPDQQPTTAAAPVAPTDRLDDAQRGIGDMGPDAFRQHGAVVIDWVADYLATVGDRPVLADVTPGEIRSRLPQAPPEHPEAFTSILTDLNERILPGITHWNHPAFHAYFAITGSGPGILAETLIAALNVNGMLWRTSPSATELEELVVDWMRQMLGMGAAWRGMITDSASMSTLVALAAAREQAGFNIRQHGMAQRDDVPQLTVYTSNQAHSSVDKAVITLGLGLDAVRRLPVDDDFRMDVDALDQAMADDLAAGRHPVAIVATAGTTSTTSVDPLPAIAAARERFAARHGIRPWLHVDGAYAGVAAIHPDFRWLLDGIDLADSLVTNPHKWLFTPIDASLLFVKDPEALIDAFALSADYLATDDDGVTDFMDWGVQLGRRFRALKLWMVLRYFGRDGLSRRIETHVAQAAWLAGKVHEHPDLVLAAPTPLSTVCLRAEPQWGPDDPAWRDGINDALMARVNATGRAFLAGTVLHGRKVIRVALGNLRTTDERLAETFALISQTLDDLRQDA